MNTSGDSGSPETEVISFFAFCSGRWCKLSKHRTPNTVKQSGFGSWKNCRVSNWKYFNSWQGPCCSGKSLWNVTCSSHSFYLYDPFWQPYIPLLQTQFQWWHQMAPKKLVSWRGRIWTFSSCWSAGSSDVYFALHRRPHFVQRSHHCHIHFEWARDCVLPTNKKRFRRNCCRYAYQSNPHRLLVFYLCHRWLWWHWLLSIIRSSHHTPFSKCS